MRKASGRIIAVVAALVLVDGVLVAVGVTGFHLNPAPPPTHAQVVATANPLTFGEVTVNAASATPARHTPTPLLSILNPHVGVVATSGCNQAGDVKGTVDAGTTFTSLRIPAKHVLDLELTRPGSAWLIGANHSCKPTYYSSSDGAVTWSRSASLHRVWIPLPTGIRSPSGSLVKPCGTAAPMPVQLDAVSATKALVLCQQGLFRTTDGGRAWEPTGPVPTGHPTAVSVTPAGHGVLLVDGQSSCAGLRVALTDDGGSSWKSQTCLSHAGGSACVALTSTGGGLVLSSGKPYTTRDFGKSWH